MIWTTHSGTILRIVITMEGNAAIIYWGKKGEKKTNALTVCCNLAAVSLFFQRVCLDAAENDDEVYVCMCASLEGACPCWCVRPLPFSSAAATASCAFSPASPAAVTSRGRRSVMREGGHTHLRKSRPLAGWWFASFVYPFKFMGWVFFLIKERMKFNRAYFRNSFF